MKYRVYAPLQGVMTAHGPETRFLDRAVKRAQALGGEVRPAGSLQAVWQASVFIAPLPAPAPLKPAPAPRTPAPRFRCPQPAQACHVTRTYPKR